MNFYLNNILVFILGLVFGSFATMASYRLIEEKNFFGRSKCIKCKNNLKIIDLIPVLSYILSCGKCTHCGQKISIRYPIIELSLGIMFLITNIYVGDTANKVLILALNVCLIILIVTDLEAYIIPDSMQLTCALIGIIYAFINHYSLIHVWLVPSSCFLIGIILNKSFKFFMGRDGLGFGDIKFFAVAGLFLKIELLGSFFFLSGIIGIICALIWRTLGNGKEFPFGPALSLSLYICLVFPYTQSFTNFIK